MMMQRCCRLLGEQQFDQAKAESGQTVTEYAVVLAVLLVATGVIVLALAGPIESFIEEVGDKVGTVVS